MSQMNRNRLRTQPKQNKNKYLFDKYIKINNDYYESLDT